MPVILKMLEGPTLTFHFFECKRTTGEIASVELHNYMYFVEIAFATANTGLCNTSPN